MYTNELFCNPLRSYPDIFKKICEMKNQLEYYEAKKQICNNLIFKKIVKDFLFYELKGEWPYYKKWRCWEKEKNNSSIIYYKHRNNKHKFTIYRNNKFITKFEFSNFLQQTRIIGFREMLFEVIKNKPELKIIFENTVLIGKEDKDLNYFNYLF